MWFTASMSAASKRRGRPDQSVCRVESYRHAVVSLTEITDFRRRDSARRRDVRCAEQGARATCTAFFPRLFRLFRESGAGHRAHAQSGRARSKRARLACRRSRARPRRAWPRHGRSGWNEPQIPANSPPVPAIRQPLRSAVEGSRAIPRCDARVDPQRIDQIYNGVDTARFAPASGSRIASKAARSAQTTSGSSERWADCTR